MAFPQDPLEVRTEVLVGDTWADATGDVYTRSPITIERGRGPESTRTSAAKASLELNNRSGQYSPRNPMSPYYGQIGRNTPVRMSVQGTESYLALDGSSTGIAATPDHASLDITGDIDVRVEATVDWYALPTQVLIGKWLTTGNQRSWMLHMQEGNLTLRWSPTGPGSFFAGAALPPLPRRAAVRATLDVNNGSGGWTVRLYWATSLDGPWTQFGGDLTDTGTTSIFASTAPLELAPTTATITPPWLPAAGRIHRAEVRSGIGGSVVAAPDFRPEAEGTTSFADSAGRTWTLAGTAEVSDRRYRFHGEISSWPSRWDLSGQDVWVPAEAAGMLRRLGQGTKALQSTLRRRIPSGSPLAYWPMEDGATATRAAATSPTVAAAAVTGLDWASDDSLAGSLPLPKLRSAATLRASVPPSSAAGWHVEMVYNLPTMPAAQTEILRVAVAGSAMRAAVVYASAAGIRIEARDSSGAVLAFFLYTAPDALAAFTGVWNRLQIFTSDAGGGQTRLSAAWLDVVTGVWSYSATVFTGTQGSATEVAGSWGAATEGMALGHLAAFDVAGSGSVPTVAVYDQADSGFAGEQAGMRMLRLAAEEASTVSLALVKGGPGTQAMGPQRSAPLLDLIEEAGDVDGGILTEARESTGLIYRDRHSLYNQTPALTLDYEAEGEIGPPLEPVEDDQKTRNDITVTREGGASGRAVLEEGPLSVQAPPNGVGLYDESVTLNLAEDEQAAPIAGWRLHLGTWDEARYPTVRLMLHAAPHLIPAFLDLNEGDLVRIVNPPSWVGPGPIDLIVQGWSETVDLYTWDAHLACTPAGPWRVGVLDNAERGKLDTAGCELGAGVTSTATSLTLVTTRGPRWVDTATHPSQFPFDIRVGGEVMTVTAISGTTTTQTATVTRSTNGIVKSHSAGAPVTVANPAVIAL
ncbi:hypothetical protein [Streptomyces sp. NPDC008121]|uniref:hypothetical protein n=1 Tax=Streptomyces sp. NPDC008121 TaxID=3364809 RepID=UPI0036F12EE9